jgi:exopolyphosphatase / guanosine-5'-triphosphate,3'-diphosphate pyrophosphatase
VTFVKDLESGSLRFRPVAVVDIGSNSVRLVVYDGLRRAPTPVVNEKILCGLGRGVSLTGNLPADGIERALSALRRFRALGKQIGVNEVFAVATAAAREAANGQSFIRNAEEALDAPITILAGKDEAQLAALGVISGIPSADGIVGDLGGGSLELVDVKDGAIRDGVTLPLGPLRLIDMSGGSVAKARNIIDGQLQQTALMDRLRGRFFYAVGGTWRNLARLHMRQTGYPLTVLHYYTMARDSARSVAGLVAGLSPASLKDVRALSRSRADTLPFGALVLDRILTAGKPKAVIVSAHGLREGLLYSKLDKRKRMGDPLLAACWDFARRYSRSPSHEIELAEWTNQLVEQGMIKESADEARLRRAASMLADISWRAHPDYRGGRSLMTITQAAFVGVDHPSRVFIALAVFYRYEGPSSEDAPGELLKLLRDDWIERARVLAAAMRLAYVLTAAMPGLLPQITLQAAADKGLVLGLRRSHADLMGETVQKRLDALASLLGRSGRVVIGQ